MITLVRLTTACIMRKSVFSNNYECSYKPYCYHYVLLVVQAQRATRNLAVEVCWGCRTPSTT